MINEFYAGMATNCKQVIQNIEKNFLNFKKFFWNINLHEARKCSSSQGLINNVISLEQLIDEK